MAISENAIGNRETCVAETIADPDWETFEVVCSVHGLVYRYSTLNIRMFGEKEVQRRIDRAWLLHASSEKN